MAVDLNIKFFIYVYYPQTQVPLKNCVQPSEEVASVIIRQMMMGVNFLYKQRHNIHRDLKPGNVLINSAGCSVL